MIKRTRGFSLGPGGLPMTEKSPTAVIKLRWDLSTYAASLGAGINVASYSFATAGLTVAEQSRSGNTIDAKVSGGTLNATASITCHVIFDNAGVPIEDDITILVRIVAT